MKTANPAKTCVRKFYVHEIAAVNLLPEKRKENM